MNNTFRLIVAIGVPLAVGLLSSISVTPLISSGWYADLAKPALNPPAWVFGPTWTVLYVLMGISLWLIWKSNSPHKRQAIAVFAVQLFLNAVWSPVFFGAQSPGNAFAIIVLLWATIVLAILIFRKVSKLAAWLLVPYILWVSFATYLNYSIWMLNS